VQRGIVNDMTLSKSSEVQSEDLCKIADEDLTRQVIQGSQDAMVVLFDRYHQLVFDVALRIVRDPGEAEDVVQTVFLDVFRAMANFDSRKGILKVWLLQYAYHRALHRKRHLVSNHFYRWENLEAAIELGSGLEALGLEVETAEHPWVHWRSLYVTDPEGNQVELVCDDGSV
jgi:DNA-directed RNA polymerase specialized sigma24 family protein